MVEIEEYVLCLIYIYIFKYTYILFVPLCVEDSILTIISTGLQ